LRQQQTRDTARFRPVMVDGVRGAEAKPAGSVVSSHCADCRRPFRPTGLGDAGFMTAPLESAASTERLRLALCSSSLAQNGPAGGGSSQTPERCRSGSMSSNRPGPASGVVRIEAIAAVHGRLPSAPSEDSVIRREILAATSHSVNLTRARRAQFALNHAQIVGETSDSDSSRRKFTGNQSGPKASWN